MKMNSFAKEESVSFFQLLMDLKHVYAIIFAFFPFFFFIRGRERESKIACYIAKWSHTKE